MYLLDANVFIQAYRAHYSFDICPGFWDWILKAHQAGTVFSIARVQDELRRQKDRVSDWADELPAGFFLGAGDATTPHLGTVSNWAVKQGYQRPVLDEFYRAADYYLVAQALELKATVVTHEYLGEDLYRVKIPNASYGVGIHCTDPFEMLRTEQARLVI